MQARADRGPDAESNGSTRPLASFSVFEVNASVVVCRTVLHTDKRLHICLSRLRYLATILDIVHD